MAQECPVNFMCGTERLYGMVHRPSQPTGRGVLVVVGGPQYRVGSHRQFVLLGRDLAAAGIPVMRFDYRGMGDSEGELGSPEPCEHLQQDIHSAIDNFFFHVPELKEVVIWALCDGASAALLYAHTDPRVKGIALLNPWVSTQRGAAKAYLKHYYLRRLINPSLWKKIVNREIRIEEAAKSLLSTIIAASGFKNIHSSTVERDVAGTEQSAVPIHVGMIEGLEQFRGQVLLILSGNDFIAAEFKSMITESRQWRNLLRSPRVTQFDFAQANHTFSSREWRDQVVGWTLNWIQSW